MLAAALLVCAVLGGLAYALQALFASKDAARERARTAEAQELACLARNEYFEARGEPRAGQYAVAEVTMNRKGAERFPDTVCGVVHEKNWDASRGRFVGAVSWTEFDVLPEPSGVEWAHAQKVAVDVYFRRAAPQLQGATHFHATYITPAWAKQKKPVARIGRHVFYR
jgi:N-acetylmuramoyl-L-alanine amidase